MARGTVRCWGALALLLPSLAGAQPREDIARRFAPVILQETHATRPRRDFITTFDFDCDWNGDNNRQGIDRARMPARVYYAVYETDTHWFVHYLPYHATDDKLTTGHEHDTESALAVVRRVGDGVGSLEALEVRFHTTWYQYAVAGAGVGDNGDNVDGPVHRDPGTGRPVVYQQAVGHGLCGGFAPPCITGDYCDLALVCLHHEAPRFNARGVRYRYDPVAARVPEPPSPGASGVVEAGYDLVPMDSTLWARRDAVGPGRVYRQALDYNGSRCASPDAGLRCPRGFGGAFQGDEGSPPGAMWAQEGGRPSLPTGEVFFDPAYAMSRRLRFREPFSLHYTHNPYVGIGALSPIRAGTSCDPEPPADAAVEDVLEDATADTPDHTSTDTAPEAPAPMDTLAPDRPPPDGPPARDASDAATVAPPQGPGCGCRTAPMPGPGPWWLLLMLGLRRRRRDRSSALLLAALLGACEAPGEAPTDASEDTEEAPLQDIPRETQADSTRDTSLDVGMELAPEVTPDTALDTAPEAPPMPDGALDAPRDTSLMDGTTDRPRDVPPEFPRVDIPPADLGLDAPGRAVTFGPVLVLGPGAPAAVPRIRLGADGVLRAVWFRGPSGPSAGSAFRAVRPDGTLTELLAIPGSQSAAGYDPKHYGPRVAAGAGGASVLVFGELTARAPRVLVTWHVLGFDGARTFTPWATFPAQEPGASAGEESEVAVTDLASALPTARVLYGYHTAAPSGDLAWGYVHNYAAGRPVGVEGPMIDRPPLGDELSLSVSPGGTEVWASASFTDLQTFHFPAPPGAGRSTWETERCTLPGGQSPGSPRTFFTGPGRAGVVFAAWERLSPTEYAPRQVYVSPDPRRPCDRRVPVGPRFTVPPAMARVDGRYDLDALGLPDGRALVLWHEMTAASGHTRGELRYAVYTPGGSVGPVSVVPDTTDASYPVAAGAGGPEGWIAWLDASRNVVARMVTLR